MYKKYSKMNKSKKSKKSRKQFGGSPSSDLVMSDTKLSKPSNDYVTSPRIRDVTGYNETPNAFVPSSMTGGSDASNMVMSQLNSNLPTKPMPTDLEVKGNMNSLNLHQTTGGYRKYKSKSNRRYKRKSNRKTKNSRSNRKSKSRRGQRGGYGSDWIMSQYSQGPINNPEMSGSSVGQFSSSTATSRDILNNPPNLGSAGSGYPMGGLEGAKVSRIGAPF